MEAGQTGTSTSFNLSAEVGLSKTEKTSRESLLGRVVAFFQLSNIRNDE